jgi:hypothetical protein
VDAASAPDAVPNLTRWIRNATLRIEIFSDPLNNNKNSTNAPRHAPQKKTVPVVFATSRGGGVCLRSSSST